MHTRRRLLVRIVTAVALLCSSCGGDSEPPPASAGVTTPTAITSPAPATTPIAATTPAPATTPIAATPPPATETHTVTVYFSTGDGTDCGEVAPFSRTIEGEPWLGAALSELLAGPTEAEAAEGASSFFSTETARSLAVVDHFQPEYVTIGFGDLASLIPNASTSCGSEALLAQLNHTVLQYVPRVRYEMLNSCQMFANWLQRECMEYTSDGAEPAMLTILERAAGSGCAPWDYGAPDGRWFGYVDAATQSGVDFDLACWFDGEAAVDAASEDGEESPPPNDHHIRNEDATLISLPTVADGPVSWLPDTGQQGLETVTFAEWVSLREGRPVQPGLWLTVRNGEVHEIVEQFVP